MRAFPQELVDMVIDKLAEKLAPGQEPGPGISNYSTVSRRWLARTQKHHFRFIHFTGQVELEMWRETIEPDPSGVSQYVCCIMWENISTLEGFGEHIRAFTRVEGVQISECEILRSLPDVESLALLGSSLVRLEIDAGRTTPRIMASLLAGLPRLRQLHIDLLEVEHDRDDTIAFPSSIPYFEGADALNLMLRDYLPGELDWIPPTARFAYLWIGNLCIHRNWARVSQWIASSGSILKYLSIGLDKEGTSLDLLIAQRHFRSHPPLTMISSQGPLLSPWTSRGAQR